MSRNLWLSSPYEKQNKNKKGHRIVCRENHWREIEVVARRRRACNKRIRNRIQVTTAKASFCIKIARLETCCVGASSTSCYEWRESGDFIRGNGGSVYTLPLLSDDSTDSAHGHARTFKRHDTPVPHSSLYSKMAKENQTEKTKGKKTNDPSRGENDALRDRLHDSFTTPAFKNRRNTKENRKILFFLTSPLPPIRRATCWCRVSRDALHALTLPLPEDSCGLRFFLSSSSSSDLLRREKNKTKRIKKKQNFVLLLWWVVAPPDMQYAGAHPHFSRFM